MFSLHDLRNAFRQLARRPAFTILTVAVLAGGLAVSIFTFSFLYTWVPSRRAIALAPRDALWRE